MAVAWPLVGMFITAWQSRGELEPGLTTAPHRVSLAFQTAALVGITLGLALPVGVWAALVVCRTDVPGGRFWLPWLVLPALLPLDLHATAWLAALGPQGMAHWFGLPVELSGLVGAAWVHAMASIAWVVALTSVGVALVEAELEESCLLDVGPLRTMWYVTIPRSAGSILAAALAVAVFTAGEMAVTDLLQVRTYAETVYTEFALAGRVGAATATALPGLAVWFGLIVLAGVVVLRRVPQDAQFLFAPRARFALGRVRFIALALCVATVSLTIVLPVWSLVWRAGLKFPRASASVPGTGVAAAGSTEVHTPSWNGVEFFRNMVDSANSAGTELGFSLMLALAAAACTVPLALVLATWARRSRVGRWVAAFLACSLLALPGPVLGIALELSLNRPTLWWGGERDSAGAIAAGWLAAIADSPAVLVWLLALRTLPYVLLLVWPVVRLVNRSVLEAAELDGVGPWQRFWHIELPVLLPALSAGAFMCAVLSIGELSGSVIVTPPGYQPLSVRIFTLAHNGVDNHLAGICLILLVVAATVAWGSMACMRWAVDRLRN